jgi:hypothetical protein
MYHRFIPPMTDRELDNDVREIDPDAHAGP